MVGMLMDIIDKIRRNINLLRYGIATEIQTVKYKIRPEKLAKCLEKIDPIESASFDISVVRHMTEGGRFDIAREYLTSAISEVERSIIAGLLNPEEGSRIIQRMEQAWDKLETIEGYREIVELQFELTEKQYKAFLKCWEESD
jgi:F420-dependent methylenetetrahydromethanopterin dehydrogenase